MKKYRFSTETESFLKELDYFDTIELLKSVGFDCFDFSLFDLCKIDWTNQCAIENDQFYITKDNYKEYCKALRKKADELGIVCNQAHAPFPTFFKGIDKFIFRAIECASILGAKYIVIHPDNNATDLENAALLQKYVDFASELNIKIATENMWNWSKEEDHAIPAACSTVESFNNVIDSINSPFLRACLDIGHAEMMKDGTSATKMIKGLGHDRLKALHIHDNDKKYDSHQISFSLNVDFYEIAKALKEIDYDGDLTLEAINYIGSHPELSLKEKATNLYKSLVHLNKLINS